jgi:hypothetical protein
MTKEIKFKTESQFLGRNGLSKAIGLEIASNEFNNMVIIRPVNSKNVTGSSFIAVPQDSISELIEALKGYVEVPVSDERADKIKYIKDVLGVWGRTTCAELELDHSPCKASIGEGKQNVSELIEEFDANGVSAVTYNDEIEIGYNDYDYEQLEDYLIDEIYEIISQYEAGMLKTESRCQD